MRSTRCGCGSSCRWRSWRAWYRRLALLAADRMSRALNDLADAALMWCIARGRRPRRRARRSSDAALDTMSSRAQQPRAPSSRTSGRGSRRRSPATARRWPPPTTCARCSKPCSRPRCQATRARGGRLLLYDPERRRGQRAGADGHRPWLAGRPADGGRRRRRPRGRGAAAQRAAHVVVAARDGGRADPARGDAAGRGHGGRSRGWRFGDGRRRDACRPGRPGRRRRSRTRACTAWSSSRRSPTS